MKITVEDFWASRHTRAVEAHVMVNENMHADPDQDSRFRLYLAGDWYARGEDEYEFVWEYVDLENFDGYSMGSVYLASDTHAVITKALQPLLIEQLKRKDR